MIRPTYHQLLSMIQFIRSVNMTDEEATRELYNWLLSDELQTDAKEAVQGKFF